MSKYYIVYNFSIGQLYGCEQNFARSQRNFMTVLRFYMIFCFSERHNYESVKLLTMIRYQRRKITEHIGRVVQ